MLDLPWVIASITSKIAYSASGEVFCQALVNQSDDFIERAGLEPFLDGDSADQAIDAFDVCGAAEKRTRCGRGFAEAFGCLGVLVEGNKVVGVRTEAGAEFRHPFVDLAGFADIAEHSILDRNHVVFANTAIVSGNQHRPLRQRHKDGIVNL